MGATLVWCKSSSSVGNGACVELAAADGGMVAVRDSKNPGGTVQYWPQASLRDFLDKAKRGCFDDFLE